MEPRNVVLVCLDTVRKDYFDGYATRLRERADASFDECRAASGWSVPSHASMVTGELPHRHGIHVYNRDFSGLSRADTFLDDLPDHRALGTSANVYASEAFGFEGMFDEFVSVSPDRRFPAGMDVERWGQECDAEGLDRYRAFLRAALDHDHPVRSLLNGALVEVDDRLAALPIPKLLDDGATVVARQAVRQADRAPEPFAMFVNFMDAHAPLAHVRGYDRSLHDAPLSWTTGAYDTHAVNVAEDPDAFATELERTRGLYAAAVDYLDRRVCEFADRLHEVTDRETTVVVTADHGENLGFEADDGLLAHKGVLTEGLLHVPLEVLNAPDGLAGTYDGDADYVSHVDLGALLVGLARGEAPDVTRERIAAERIGSNMAGNATDEERAEWDRMIRVVYEGTTKHEWDSRGVRARHRLDRERPSWQSYLDDDVPVERLEPALFDGPLEEYKRRAVEGEAAADVDETTAARLRDLGYL
jgi:arylsulfatase A-like enzyme